MSIFDLYGSQIRKQPFTPDSEKPTVTTKPNSSIAVINSLFNGHIMSVQFMYDQLPQVSAPVDMVIDKALDIPLTHQVKKGDSWVDVENSEYDEFLKRPNQFERREAFEKNILLNEILFGEVIINKYIPVGFRQKDGKAFVFPATSTSIMYDFYADFRQKYIQSIMYNGIQLTDPNDYIYYRATNSAITPDHRAVSRLSRLLLTGSVLKAIGESQYKLIASRGALGILHPSGDMNVLGSDDILNIQKAYYEKTGITGDKDNLLITGRQLDYKQIGLNVADLQLNESELREFRTVCKVLNVPPIIVGDVERSTYNNYQTAETIFYRNAVMPKVKVRKTVLEALLIPDTTKERFNPDYSEISALQPSRELTNKVMSQMYRDGVIDANEYRTSDNFDEKPTFDEKYYEKQTRNNQADTQGENEEN